METTYTVISIQDGYVWEFKYDLNGEIMHFKKLNGSLKQKQADWLIGSDIIEQIMDEITGELELKKTGERKGKFAINENIMKEVWIPNLKKNFKIEVNAPTPTFDLFWKTYPENKNSVKKVAKERWEKLTEANKIKLMKNLPEYIKEKRKANHFFPYAEVFIRQGWWDK
ncbi:hypothetical protein [Flavobacterium branchiophilum]|uniref:Uncharacterized protein n=1 Tax=Flavobacterium branchiophilum TaxID=55197 RepID=A0A2H3KRM2_9FLAO|nr:hypothetical protein [Flavobacterium branchiophilum]PDS24664.1 hypothetical protein B0A77_07295 [Flavobacterium branchiophilum]